MKIKIILVSIILLLVIVFASGCIPVLEKLGLVSPTNEEQLSPEKAGPPDGLVKVLIGFKEKPGKAQQAMVRGVGGKIKYTYHIVDAIAASIPEASIAGLKANPNVTHVHLDGRVQALDDELDDSWGVKRIGSGDVHDIGNTGDGVKVAIIDTGIDYTHADLDANYIDGYDFVNKDNDPMDDSGHGTHVAGTVAAEDDSVGVVGVAPDAALYALKVLDETGGGFWSDVIAAIQWSMGYEFDFDDDGAIDEWGVKVDVINMSLGGTGTSDVEAACQAADDAGLLLVAAAGNSGNPPGKGDNVIEPASYASVIAVAATDQSDKRARFSSTGPDVELAAPGVAINSTLLGGGYGEKNGTSMASPHVAGTAALVIAAEISSNVRTQLQNTVDDLGDSGRDSLYGYGLVDAAEAVAPSVPVTDIAITAVSAPSSAIQGEVLEISVTVENVGNQEVTDDINVTLTDDNGTDDVTIDTQKISGGLTAGDSTTLAYSWNTGSATVSDHTLTASHDFADNDANNDSKNTTVTVNEPTAGVIVTSIEPDSMDAGTSVDVTITGSGFVDGAEVTFENGVGPAPIASIVTLTGNTITATVAAKSGGPPSDRLWDVRVTNNDGSSGVLEGGFTVTP
jgi:hypothetical protein